MKKLFAASLALCFVPVALAAPPDFSGNYVLDASTAPAAEGRRKPIGIIHIEQKAGKIVITEWYDKQNRVDVFHCDAGGACVYIFREGVPGQTDVSALAFDGGDLVIKNLRTGGTQELRRFALSPDKKTLSMKMFQARPSTLVYRRE